jgi:glutathione S-transferase
MPAFRRCGAIFPEDTRRDLARIFALWAGARAAHGAGGPFLFGARSIADAFYAPVAARLRTYGVAAPEVIGAYCQTLYADSAYGEWEADALKEVWDFPKADGLYQ